MPAMGQEQDQGELLLGKIGIEALQSGIYRDWYTANHEDYEVNMSLVHEFKKDLKAYHLLLFMGTWCSDSQREVPRLMKILETANFPMDKLKIVALDREKRSPNGEEWGLAVHWVPTLLFLKEGKEINRIVESPLSSLEADMLAIVSGEPYKNLYAE